MQFATAGSGDSSGSSMQSTKINVSSIKCASIDSGMSLMNSHISKKINLSHCQEIVISEELAKKGISEYLNTFINNTELTKDAEIIISKCSAKEYIKSVEPVFEGLLSEYYPATHKSNSYAAYATNMNLSTFYCLLKDSYFQPYATLGNISESSDSKNSSSTSNSQTEEVPIDSSVNANFIAGNYKIEDKNPIQNIGFAAFNNDKLVGEFTGLDALCFLIINNEFEESIISIPSPFDDGRYIELSLTSNKKTKCNVDLNSSVPTVHVTVHLTGFGHSMNEKTSYSNIDSTAKIQHSAESYMKEKIEEFLYKSSKEYNSDICGFGRFAVKNYLTMEKWENSHWLENYKNCNFDVNVSFNIKAGNVFSET